MSSSCHVCGMTNPPYTCPRCNMPYCSLPCFQSPQHRVCSETFAKRQLDDALKGHTADQDGFRERLQQLVDEDTLARYLDGGIGQPGEDRVWELLGVEGRAAFLADLPRIMSEYTPWFSRAVVDDQSANNSPAHCPPPPRLAQLTKRPPSPLVWHNLVEVLFWYCCLQRKELGDAPNEIELIDASPILAGALSAFPSLEAVVRSIDDAIEHLFPEQTVAAVLTEWSRRDLVVLLDHPARCLACLRQMLTETCQRKREAHYRRLVFLAAWLDEQLRAGAGRQATLVLQTAKQFLINKWQL